MNKTNTNDIFARFYNTPSTITMKDLLCMDEMDNDINFNVGISSEVLEQYVKKQPIVKLVMGDCEKETSIDMRNYLAVKADIGKGLHIRMSHFMSDFTSFLVVRNISGVFKKKYVNVNELDWIKVESYDYITACEHACQYDWTAVEVINKLTNLAMGQIYQGAINGKLILQQFTDGKLHRRKVMNNFTNYWLMEATLHFFVEVDPCLHNDKGGILTPEQQRNLSQAKRNLRRRFRFKNTHVFMFLISQNIFLRLKVVFKTIYEDYLKNKNSHFSILKFLPKHIVDVITDFDTYSDVSLILFGLMSKEEQFRLCIMKNLFIDLCIHMSSVGTSSSSIKHMGLCVEIFYEMGDHSLTLFDIFKETSATFCPNGRINYRNRNLRPARSLYMMNSVGYLMSTLAFGIGFELPRNIIGSEDLYAFAMYFKEIKENDHLTILPLEYLNFQGNILLNMEVMTSFLYTCRNITHLNLNGCRIGDTEFIAISVCLYDTPLAHLSLSNNMLTDKSCQPLHKWLAHIHHLEDLDLSENKFTDEVVQVICDRNLPHLSTLKHLSISNNDIHDKGFIILANEIKHFICLLNLDVSHNRITDVRSMQLINEVNTLDSIKCLDIRCIGLSSSQMEGIRQQVKIIKEGRSIHFEMIDYCDDSNCMQCHRELNDEEISKCISTIKNLLYKKFTYMVSTNSEIIENKDHNFAESSRFALKHCQVDIDKFVPFNLPESQNARESYEKSRKLVKMYSIYHHKLGKPAVIFDRLDNMMRDRVENQPQHDTVTLEGPDGGRQRVLVTAAMTMIVPEIDEKWLVSNLKPFLLPDSGSPEVAVSTLISYLDSMSHRFVVEEISGRPPRRRNQNKALTPFVAEAGGVVESWAGCVAGGVAGSGTCAMVGGGDSHLPLRYTNHPLKMRQSAIRRCHFPAFESICPHEF